MANKKDSEITYFIDSLMNLVKKLEVYADRIKNANHLRQKILLQIDVLSFHQVKRLYQVKACLLCFTVHIHVKFIQLEDLRITYLIITYYSYH